MKCRQLEEHIRTLESHVYDKDSIIHDLQRKLDKAKRVNFALIDFFGCYKECLF